MRRSPGLGDVAMTDPDEVQLSKLAKKVLSTPPKKRVESKLGGRQAKPSWPVPNGAAVTKKGKK
jgi:hypothetical protein